MTEVAVRRRIADRGKRLEYFTIAWNSLEGLVAVVAGAIAGSISLVGFGIDSFIEVTSGATLLWRMSVDADERFQDVGQTGIRSVPDRRDPGRYHAQAAAVRHRRCRRHARCRSGSRRAHTRPGWRT